MKSMRIMIFSFVIGLILLNGLNGQTLQAQHPKVPLSSPFSQTQLKGVCRIDPSITFSEEQGKELENLQRAYLAEARPLWSKLRDLRLEMRYAVSDAKIQSKALIEKQREISAIQAKLESLRFSYVIKARAIFTKEQLERFPSDCPLKMGTGYGMGKNIGKGFQRGTRW